MKQVLIVSILICLVISLSIGIVRYNRVDSSMKISVWYLTMQLASEIGLVVTAETKQWALRAIILNIYVIVEVCLVSIFFIVALKPYHPEKKIIAGCLFWTILGVLNMVFLQKPTTLNSNFLQFAALGIMTMSLYYINHLVRSCVKENMFKIPHFRIAFIWLVMWCSTFFFWAFIKVLYDHHWVYSTAAMYSQVVLNCVMVVAIGHVLFSYPKSRTYENK